MNITLQFQELDNLILSKTHPPVTAELRNKLHLMREQIDAYQASSDRQDETLSTQIRKIETLVEENEKLKSAQPKPTADTEPELRRGLRYLPRDPNPVCPFCWRAKGEHIPLFGPVALAGSKTSERWECHTCNTNYTTRDGGDFIPREDPRRARLARKAK